MRLSGEHVECEAGDLGEAGMLLFPRSSFVPFNQPIELRFTLPRAAEHVELRGSVERCELRAGRMAWAVTFAGVSPVVGRMLRTFVHVGHGRVVEYQDGC